MSPLNVTIDINGVRIERLKIGRVAGTADADSLNVYTVFDENGKALTMFTHLYGEGARRCVELALAALRVAEGAE